MQPLTRRALLAGAGAPFVRAAVDRPNLLLIMTDQQTHDAMSCAGNPWLKTPAMDSLAAGGVRFAQCYTPYPVCSPARSSVFTSRMPHETGVRVNGKAIRSGMPTMGEIFRDAGYETVYGGKWHLPRSFDGMTAFTCLIGGSSQGKDMDEPLATACAQWLRSKPRQPFLMVASFMNPHDICQWIRDHKGRREHPNLDQYPPAPLNMAVDPDEPEFVRYHRTQGIDKMSEGVGIAAEWRVEEFRHYLHDYYRMVEAVDRQIGRLLAALRETGLDRNTWVIFTSDHGEGMGAHRWVQKASFYDESVRVPFLVSGPGIRRGGAVDRESLVSLVDILPSFCDLAGVPAPSPVRGASLRGALDGKPLNREFVVSELRYGDEKHEGRMVRTARFKYIVFNGGQHPEQFFDRETDPGEIRNLARDPDYAKPLAAHRAILRQWIQTTEDDFRPPTGT